MISGANATDNGFQSLWRECIANGDFTRLATFADAFSAISQLCDHDYPAFHRLFDIASGDRAFRVCRCAACNERIFLSRLPFTQAGSELGVPFELTGAALQRWIADETANESYASVDWTRYLCAPRREAIYPPVSVIHATDFVVSPAGTAHPAKSALIKPRTSRIGSYYANTTKEDLLQAAWQNAPAIFRLLHLSVPHWWIRIRYPFLRPTLAALDLHSQLWPFTFNKYSLAMRSGYLVVREGQPIEVLLTSMS